MKQLQMITLVTLAMILATVAGVSTASATTLETNGLKKSAAVTMKATLVGSTTLKDTSNAFANTCTASTLEATTTVFTGASVSGPVSTLSFSKCTHELVVVDAAGSISIDWIKGTTNGTVRSSGAKWTMPMTIFGSVVTMTCTTSNTDIGTVTGTASGSSTIDLNGILGCGSFLPSAKWEGTYVITGHALGVVE
jgi:hypothetical protein